MNSAFKRMICRFMAIALITAPFQTGQASMIGTAQLGSVSTVQIDRNIVLDYLNRSETTSQLQTMGVSAETAKDRVAAMTDGEVSTLAAEINAVPAGGDGLVVLILVVFIVWYIAFRK
jgi:hypothetical protein